MIEADVIVVGAGPSGLTVATELALGGARVVVLERREAGVQSRAGTVLPRVLELFDYRGHAQKFIECASEIRSNPLIPFHIWAGLQPVHWAYTGSAFGYRLIIPQNTTEEILLDNADALNIPILRGHTVTGITQSADEVVVEATLPDGETRSFRSSYVVGADGGRSAIRSLTEIPFTGRDGTFTGIIADVRVDMKWPEGRAMVDNEHGWAASFPFGEGGKITRFNMVHADRRRADKREPVTSEEVAKCLAEIFQRPIEFEELIWASRFDDAMRIADRFRDGRVFLVGESSRIHYPASGVGMNFCIQDAFNLGWKLASVVRGDADEKLLDTYELERRPVAEALLESVRAQCAVQFDFSNEGIAFKRMFARDILPLPEVNRAIGLQLNGLTNPYMTSVGHHPLAGRPLPDLTIQTAHGRFRVAELLVKGETLLLDLTANHVFEDSDSRVSVVSGRLSLPSEELEGVTALLVRPDGYVHWVSTDTVPSNYEARSALALLFDGVSDSAR